MEFKMVDKEVARHRKMIEGIHETYKKKNRDYGDAFGVSLDKRGLVAALVRMEDKLGRLDSLKDRDPLVKDESLQDTLLDLANYAIMTAMWLERKGEEKVTEVYADGKVAITINNEKVAAITTEDYLAMRSIVNDTLKKIDDDIEEVEEMTNISVTPTEVKTGHEGRADKPLSPGLTLKPNEKVYITNYGSFTIEGSRLVTRNTNGHVVSSTEIKDGATLVLRVVAE